jgi:hypothetical protein
MVPSMSLELVRPVMRRQAAVQVEVQREPPLALE